MRSSRTAMHALQRTPALTTINVGEVNHETGKGANYEVPAKITPIQVKPSSFYNQGPQPIQPYLPQSRTNSGYQQLSGGYQQPSGGYQQPNGGYQHPSGGYLQPHQSFQPPPPSLLQPQPFSIPQAPVYQPQPPYQVSPVQSTPQQGCCGGQLFSQQGGLCMPMNFNPCQGRQQYSSGGGCGVCSPTCVSACPRSAQSCGSGNCCVARSPACCPQPMASLCCNQVVQSCCQPQQRQCCNSQNSSCCPNPFQGCCCNRSQMSGLCRRRSKRSVGRLLGLCGSEIR
ncbi:hypothetical protein RB195_003124 [Necator americanus]|uniref:Uncharacterized protein n=1 Tax=Necator americanus TaxID=51031 RepID=A0ABR1DM47_NECAM